MREEEKNHRSATMSITSIAVLLILFFSGCGGNERTAWSGDMNMGYIYNHSQLILMRSEDLSSREVVAKEKAISSWDWSETGDMIVYATDEGIYQLFQNGGRKLLCKNGFAPKLSRDGEYLAFLEEIHESSNDQRELTSSGLRQLKIIDLNSQRIQQIGEGIIFWFDWSFDSKNIIYYCGVGSPKGKENTTLIYDLSSEKESILLEEPVMLIKCSPTTTTVALGVKEVELESERLVLTLIDFESLEIKKNYENEYLSDMAWSPDGEECVLYYEGRFRVLNNEGETMYELKSSDQELQGSLGCYGGLEWSPNEDEILFVKEYADKMNVPDIYIWDLSAERILQSGQVVHSIRRMTFEGNNIYAKWNPRIGAKSSLLSPQ